MDVSPEYIKMCEKATKIQELRQELISDILANKRFNAEQFIGDWFAFRDTRWKEGQWQIEVFHHDNDEGRDMLGEYHQFDTHDFPEMSFMIIWLPRQDELQEMIGDYETQLKYLRRTTWNWWHDEDHEFNDSNIEIRLYLKQFTSMEQLWLAFVMHERFNKVWSSEREEWITKN